MPPFSDPIAASVTPLTAIVLAGGSGTRFWPLSRRARPKQLLTLEGKRSLLQATIDRLAPLVRPEDVWISTTEQLVEALQAQLPEVPRTQFVLEPVGRNTAPAIAWALHRLPEERRRGVVVVLPADHRIGDAAAFQEASRGGDRGGARSRPDPGPGSGAALGRDRIRIPGARAGRQRRTFSGGSLHREAGSRAGRGVRRFGSTSVERRHLRLSRRDPAAAPALVSSRSWRRIWNASLDSPERVDELYPRLKSISIDYAVMERLDDLYTVALDCDWSDLGSWSALADVREKDAFGNVVHGEVVAVDAARNLLFAEHGTIAVVGVEGLVVVRTEDSVLVLPLERAQEVRAILAELEARGLRERT